MSKALSYLTQGSLRRAFDSWRSECGRASEKRELVRRATNWMLQSGLAKVRSLSLTPMLFLGAEAPAMMPGGIYISFV